MTTSSVNLVQLLRIHTGLSISLALMSGGVMVCTLLAVIMGRSGASLRPIVWFGGLFALVVVPHFLGNLYIASRSAKSDALRSSALAKPPAEDTSAGDGPLTNQLQNLFGPDIDPHLTTDARNIGGGVFEFAESARFAVLPSGESVLLAQFKSSSQAEKAWIDYLRVSGLNQLQGIVFFHYEHHRVLGLQIDDQGRFKPELNHAYTFNLNEMKSPLIEAVTRAGWDWRPTVWQGPTWLRWLTE